MVAHLTLSSVPQEVLVFSRSSAQGRAFLKHLTDLSISGTLFVPQNSGLPKNKVSGIPGAYTLARSVICHYHNRVQITPPGLTVQACHPST